MKTEQKEKIRHAVRERYGSVAEKGVSVGGESLASCCGSEARTFETNPTVSQGCCGQDLPLDKMSRALGYSREAINSVPEGANMGLGCGNPVALASLKPGETVVDLGCGGGFDCFLASREVGETGKVIGVDMTPEMLSKARMNVEETGRKNVEFRLGEIEHLPVADNHADVIMSNCVINLSPDKLDVYREAFRVLKPGGRLMISDILATARIPDDIRNNLALLTACIGGAATIDDTNKMLEEAGFQKITITPNEKSREFIEAWVPGKGIEGHVVSATIEAVKPRL